MGLPFHDSARPRGDIAIVGSGAIGRCLAASLCEAGHKADLFGRSDSIRAIRSSNDKALYFRHPADRDFRCTNVALKSYSDKTLSAYQTVIYTVKAGYLPQVLRSTRHLIKSGETAQIFIQGGIQWWFGHVVGHNLGAITDPENIASLCPPSKAIAGMITFGAQIPADRPSAAILKSTSEIKFGQLDGGMEKALALQSLFDGSPIKSGTTESLVPALWAKAAGSFAMSAFALMTNQTLGEMVGNQRTFARMIDSAETLQRAGAMLGFHDETDYAQYLGKIAASKPDHKMSILHDPSEHAAIIDTPIAIARELGFDTSDLEDIAEHSRLAAYDIVHKKAPPAPEMAGVA